MSQRSPNSDPNRKMTGRQGYNLVTDTIGGPNIRLRDNLIQGLAVLGFSGLGALLGLMAGQGPGLLVGLLLGLIGGTLLSGAVLMIFRAIQHARGRHD
jgi:hypothetical protein